MRSYRNVSGERRIWPFLPQLEGGRSYELDADEVVELPVEADAEGEFPAFDGLQLLTPEEADAHEAERAADAAAAHEALEAQRAAEGEAVVNALLAAAGTTPAPAPKSPKPKPAGADAPAPKE